VALVLTSIPLHVASRAAGDGRRESAWRATTASFVVQLVYIVWQLHDYVHTIDVYDPRQSAWSSIFVTLLGADHLHVLVGLLLDVWLLAQLARGLTSYRLVGLRATTFYWHAVNAITAVVFFVQIAPRL